MDAVRASPSREEVLAVGGFQTIRKRFAIRNGHDAILPVDGRCSYHRYRHRACLVQRLNVACWRRLSFPWTLGIGHWPGRGCEGIAGWGAFQLCADAGVGVCGCLRAENESGGRTDYFYRRVRANFGLFWLLIL
jgi:hypothetical protein